MLMVFTRKTFAPIAYLIQRLKKAVSQRPFYLLLYIRYFLMELRFLFVERSQFARLSEHFVDFVQVHFFLNNHVPGIFLQKY